MNIAIKMEWTGAEAVSLLNWLARHNAVVLRRDPSFPLLYDSRVVYTRREVGEPPSEDEAESRPREVWCDALNALVLGREDCDGLAAWRVGEVLAWGWRAIRPGDPGWQEAQTLRPAEVRAEVMLRYREPPGTARDARGDKKSRRRRVYHCLAQYWIGGKRFIDDPSLRLGMRDGEIDPRVRERWAALLEARAA